MIAAIVLTSSCKDGNDFGDGYVPSLTPANKVLVTSITLSQTSISLSKGSMKALSATVLPSNASNKDVTWSSSNTAVATVNSSGVVTALTIGTCIITCTAKDGSGVLATCAVTVIQLVTGITLNEISLSLNSGDTQTLTATISPSDATDMGVTWSSSDVVVATVNPNGLVTARAVGTCIITCTAKDGSGVTATCAVTVASGIIDGHAYVDLGLPSGTLWATCNIGADNPEDYGDYFAWGETTGYNDGKTDFNWSTYQWCKGSSTTMTKYCNDSSYGNNGFTDTLTELQLEDDAAYVNWGSDWRMPSNEQFHELINSSYTTTAWTTQNGVNGRKITSKNNRNSIFLPAAGYRYYTSLFSTGSYGYFWSRTLYTSYPLYACYLDFDSSNVNTSYSNNRCYGRSVRPVRVSQN